MRSIDTTQENESTEQGGETVAGTHSFVLVPYHSSNAAHGDELTNDREQTVLQS